MTCGGLLAGACHRRANIQAEHAPSVFRASATPLDLGDAATTATTGNAATIGDGSLGDAGGWPLVLVAVAEKFDRAVAAELRRALLAHRGDTPIQVRLVCQERQILYALPHHPVTVSPMLLGELKAMAGMSPDRKYPG
jgi:hypothetical protein